MNIPRLRIGQWEFQLPLISGGMGVKISGRGLVKAVLAEGCLGTLTSMGLGDLAPGISWSRFITTSREALQSDMRALRSSTHKPFAVNVMGALTNADDLVTTAVQEGANIIVYGAGIPLTLPKIVENPNVTLVPIISSARLAKMICDRWKRYGRTPDAFIIEGPLAGGHLGFSLEQLAHLEDFSLEKILQETLAIIQPFEQECGRKIPLITAGGIHTGEDIARFLSLGASGVQMGTRFVATVECPVSWQFKQAYINARTEDLRIVKTPVGMPGRVIANAFVKDYVQRQATGSIPKIHCPFRCIHSCERDKAGFCIAERLDYSFNGDVENGLIFAGANVYRIDRILTVHELVTELMDGVRASKRTLPSTI